MNKKGVLIMSEKRVDVKKHYLKILPENLFPILEGKKTCEVRVNDRDYRDGYILVLRAWDKDLENWENDMEFEREITWTQIIPGTNYVCLSIKESL